MASSIWLLGSFHDYQTLYPSKRKIIDYIHEVKQLYFYDFDSNKRLILRHDTPKTTPLHGIMYNSTIEHCLDDKQFRPYVNNQYVKILNPTDITIDHKNKLLHIKAHRWLIFLKPRLTLKIDRIWASIDNDVKRLVALPLYDRVANRILFIIPTRLKLND